MATATQAPAEMLVNQSENEFEYLFQQYWQRGFHFALQTVGNREDAMDLAQEAFLQHPPALGSKGLRPAVCTVVLQDSSQPSDRSTQKTSFRFMSIRNFSLKAANTHSTGCARKPNL